MSGVGFVLPILAIGLGALSIKPQRGFMGTSVGNVTADVTLEEVHRDDLEITDHPVEKGPQISDHAFKRPEEVIIKCAWSNSPNGGSGLLSQAMGLAAASIPAVRTALAIGGAVSAAQSLLSGNDSSQAKAVYAQLVALQASCIPFDIQTGKREYKNMLFKSLSVTTDKTTENVLMLTAVCRQIIIAKTQTVDMPVNSDAQASPEKTTPVADAGTKQLKGTTSASSQSGSWSGGASGDW